MIHTKDILADALRKADLPVMAAKAAEGYYHDFLSPLDIPCLHLDADLLAAASAGNVAALALRARHHNGDFDASLKESDEWAASPEGRATMAMLIKPHHQEH